jgi:hypothetical protein
MEAPELKPNHIVRGAIFPEPVKILTTVPIGDAIKLIGDGIETGRVHQPILTVEQIATLEISPDKDPFDGDPARFRLRIEAMRLGLAYGYDPYFSLSLARVDPLPHQLEAVYDYFLKVPRIRFLLADDPGAGKTIMAGLLIKELKVRGLIQRVLIVTPANLSFQWQRELKDKFRETFQVVRSDILWATYGANPWQDIDQVITSVSWLSRIEDAKESLMRSRWDLIIVDEAHKMSAYSEDKKTLAYQLGEELSEMTDHYLLMTATPHKGDPENFSLFLRLLDRDVYGDVKSLEKAMETRAAPFYLRRVKEAMVTFPDPDTGAAKSLRTLWLAKKANRSVALQLVPNPTAKRVDFQIIVKQRDGWVDQANPKTKIENPPFDGTVKRGSATCPCCGYTTPVARVREQLKPRRGGTFDARQLCAISETPGETGAQYRPPTADDERAPNAAEKRLAEMTASQNGGLSPVPDEPYPDETASGALSASVLYGLKTWGDLFQPDQRSHWLCSQGWSSECRRKSKMWRSRKLRRLVSRSASVNSPITCRPSASGGPLVAAPLTLSGGKLCLWLGISPR